MITIFQELGPLCGIIAVTSLCIAIAIFLTLIGQIIQSNSDAICEALKRLIKRQKNRNEQFIRKHYNEPDDWLKQMWEEGNKYDGE